MEVACLLRQLSECESRHFFKNQYVLVPVLFPIIQPWAGHCQGVPYYTSIVDPHTYPDPDSIRIQCGFNWVPRSVSGFGIQVRIRNPGPDSESRSGFGIQVRIRNPGPDPGGQKIPTNIEKSYRTNKFYFWMCSMFSFEGISCSLDSSKLQFLIQKNIKNVQRYFFSSVLAIKTLDPDQSKAVPVRYPDRTHFHALPSVYFVYVTSTYKKVHWFPIDSSL